MTDGKAQRPEGSAEAPLGRSEHIHTPEGRGGEDYVRSLAERIVSKVHMGASLQMSPAEIATVARALLSSPRVERERALEEAAKVAEALAAELTRLQGSSDRRVQIGSHLETCATIAAGIRTLSTG